MSFDHKHAFALLLGLSLALSDWAFAQVGEPAPDRPQATPLDRERPPSGEPMPQRDPTIPSDEILRLTPQPYQTSAEELFESAKRLAEAGLVEEAGERVAQLQALPDAPLELQDEAAIWWATVAPQESEAETNEGDALLESAKRLAQAGLIEEAGERIAQLQALPDAPLELQDEAAVWWAETRPDVPTIARVDDSARTAMPAPVAVPSLPPVPKVTLKGLVLGASDRGTAMLTVGQTTVSIALVPREDQDRVKIPSDRLAILRSSPMAATGRVADQNPDGSDTVEMSLESSFFADGVLFNLEGFSSTTLLFRAVPHDEVVLVRKEG